MSLNTTATEGFELPTRPANAAEKATKTARKSLVRRLFDKMAANAQRQAFARLAVTNPRMAADLRAAWDRAIDEAKD